MALLRDLKSRLALDDEVTAQLRLELVRTFARNHRILVFNVPVTIVLLSVVNLRWISLQMTLTWGLLSLLCVGLFSYSFARILKTKRLRPDQSVQLLLRVTASMVPFLLIWPSMVFFVWVDNDPVNNVYLIIFVFANVAASVALWSPILPIAILGVVSYWPIILVYRMHTGSYLDWALPGLELFISGFLIYVAVVMHKTVRESIRQRLVNDRLVLQLAEARDIAERANRSKSAFLANMSHELRTPLNAVIGFSDMILQGIFGPMSPAKYRSYIEDIHDSGKHLLSLINDVLDLAKIEAGKREFVDSELDIAQVADEALRFVGPQAVNNAVELKAAIEPGLFLVADARAIKQVLTNLLSNAVKFTRQGGTVTVFARRQPGGGLVLGVRDDGIGMNEEGIRRALEPFEQVDHMVTVEGQGTGLGLPIVKTLLEAHGAVFHLQSTPNKGTEVWGAFPPGRLIAKAA